jgi:hypothetical protein
MLLVFLFLSVGISHVGFSADVRFDKSEEYRIIFESSAHESTIIKQAKIEGIKLFGGKEFLAFTTSSTLKPIEGYVLLSSVRAIIPYAGSPLTNVNQIE